MHVLAFVLFYQDTCYTLTLIADMHWLKVTAIVLYGGVMICDHVIASNPGVSCGLLAIRKIL